MESSPRGSPSRSPRHSWSKSPRHSWAPPPPPPPPPPEIFSDRTVVFSGLSDKTLWEDLKWQIEYCGLGVEKYYEHPNPADPEEKIFVVMFEDASEAEEALYIMPGMEINDRPVSINPAKVIEQGTGPVTINELKAGVSQSIMEFKARQSYCGTAAPSADEGYSDLEDISSVDSQYSRSRVDKYADVPPVVKQKIESISSMEPKKKALVAGGLLLAAGGALFLSKKKDRKRKKDAHHGYDVIIRDINKLLER
eukprot:TRINITY_DN13727_c0_g1_i1.p1 TRINITY_DN13727_c0_g1~~TRINITY_DN13727_c0_g1_i1.p1  ORF type:complete len:273 (+),score=40.48 TRINITY_DN13727_c0_g1_i1:64-819(+)